MPIPKRTGQNNAVAQGTIPDYFRSLLDNPFKPRVGSIPPASKTGQSYRDAELLLAARAGGGMPGGNMGGSTNAGLAAMQPLASSPAERAYQSAKAEATAMSASDPLFKKYQVADLTKAYNAAKTNEEKQSIGLQIWAQTNPQLAAKLRPGQTGYEEVRQAPGMMASTGDFRPIAGGVLPADVDATSLAKAPTFAQPENPLEEVLPPGMLGSSFPGGLQFPESLVPAGVGENLPTESFRPTALEAFDPSAIDLDQTKRKLLIQAYNRGLK